MRRWFKSYLWRALAWSLCISAVGRGAVDGMEEESLPWGEVVAEGQTVTLVAEVSGAAAPFGYQWFRNGLALPEQTGSGLRFDYVEPADAGTYTVLVSSADTAAPSLPIYLAVTPAPRSRVANVSVVGSIADPLVAEFDLGPVASEANPTNRMLVRASGPSLGQFGVAGTLDDPVLSLHREGRLLASNDNWDGTDVLARAISAVGAYPFQASSRDAALITDLLPGRYTARVADAAGRRGVAMVEIYDTSPGPSEASPRLKYVSARALVGPGPGRLVAGFTIEGGSRLKLLLRGIGPSLTQFGISGVLANPRLALVRDASFLASNDKWADANPREIVAAAFRVGAFALAGDASDSALLVTLPPGSYTVDISAPTGAGGVALLEVYEVP